MLTSTLQLVCALQGYEYYGNGRQISGVGDINGDGIDDFAIGAPGTDPNGRINAGSTYIIYGKDSSEDNYFSSNIDLPNLADSDGIRINGERIGDSSGNSVTSGDINNDGYNDIIIGASNADSNGAGSGSTYVIFGNEDGLNADIELSSIANGDGRAGFRLDGERGRDISGRSVSTGDINNDGHDDLVIGAQWADPNGHLSGSTYVVFGKAASNFTSGTIDLATIVASNGSSGFRIDGEREGDWSGFSVSAAGDINNDGYDDIIIGAINASPNGSDSGSTYVVFGKAAGDFNSGTIDLATIVASNGRDGFRIDGERTDDSSGYSVASAGDFNGDGYDDIIIGAAWADPNGDKSGSTYVVFGKAASGFSSGTIDLAAIVASNGRDGFRLDGESAGDDSGRSVSSAGDVNHDGYDDISIRANGSSYVIYGHATSVSIEGDAYVGEALMAVGGPSEETAEYLWKRYHDNTVEADTIEVIGTGREYTLTDDDMGKTIKVEVNFINPNGERVHYYSDATPAVAKINIALTNQVTSLEENADTSFRTKIADIIIIDSDGVRSGTLELAGTDVAKFEVDGSVLYLKSGASLDYEEAETLNVRVQLAENSTVSADVLVSVTNVDEGDTSFRITSDNDITAAVAGDVLTVALSSSDPDGDGTFSYQWQRDGSDIAGATSTSYTIARDDEGITLTVVVSYTDGGGNNETVTTSAVTVPVDMYATAIDAVRQLAVEENADTSSRIKVADIDITDDDGGRSGTLELVGTDADKFEIVGNVLYVKAGVKAG